MIAENLPFRTAFEEVKKVRSSIKPNPGFAKQLEELEAVIKA